MIQVSDVHYWLDALIQPHSLFVDLCESLMICLFALYILDRIHDMEPHKPNNLKCPFVADFQLALNQSFGKRRSQFWFYALLGLAPCKIA